MWPANLENAAIQQCEDILREMEIESYSKIVSVFRAKGNLTEDKRKLLKQISTFLNIPGERQRAEARRVTNNSTLSTIAEKLTGHDGTLDWFEEGKWLVPIPDRPPIQNAYTPLADYIAGIASFGSTFIEKANRACALIQENQIYNQASSSKSLDFDDKVIESAKGLLKASNLRDASVQTMKRKAPPPRGCTYCKRRKELRKKKLAALQKKKANDEETKESTQDNESDVEEKEQVKNKKEEFIIELPSGRKIIVENTVISGDGKEEIHDISATIIAQEVEIETEPNSELKSGWEESRKSDGASTSSRGTNNPSNESDITDPESQNLQSDADQGNVRTPRILSTGQQTKRPQANSSRQEYPTRGKGASNDRKKRRKSEDRDLDNSIWSGDWAARGSSGYQKAPLKKSVTKKVPQRDNIILQSDVESQFGYTKKRPEPCISGHEYAQKSTDDNSNPYKREYKTSFKFVHRRNAKPSGQSSPETKSKATSQSTKFQKSHISKNSPDREFEESKSDECQDDLPAGLHSNATETVTTSTHFSNRKQSFDRVNHRKGESYPPTMVYTPHTYSRKSIKRYETVVKPQLIVSPSFKSPHGPELISGVSYSMSGESSKLDVRTSNLSEFKKYDISVSDKNVISLQSPLGHLHKMSSSSMASNQLLTLDEGLLIKGRNSEHHLPLSRNKIYNGGKKDMGPPPQEAAEILVESPGGSVSKFLGSHVNEHLQKSEEVTVINGHEQYIVLSGEEDEYLTTDSGHFVIPVRSEGGTLAEVSADGELQFDPNDGRFDSQFHTIPVQHPGKVLSDD